MSDAESMLFVDDDEAELAEPDIAAEEFVGADDDVHGSVGQTLEYLQETLEARHPASLKTCVFVRKECRRDVDVRVDYLGLEIPDVWVVGYGLDYADQYRALPYIAALEPEDG